MEINKTSKSKENSEDFRYNLYYKDEKIIAQDYYLELNIYYESPSWRSPMPTELIYNPASEKAEQFNQRLAGSFKYAGLVNTTRGAFYCMVDKSSENSLLDVGKSFLPSGRHVIRCPHLSESLAFLDSLDRPTRIKHFVVVDIMRHLTQNALIVAYPVFETILPIKLRTMEVH